MKNISQLFMSSRVFDILIATQGLLARPQSHFGHVLVSQQLL